MRRGLCRTWVWGLLMVVVCGQAWGAFGQSVGGVGGGARAGGGAPRDMQAFAAAQHDATQRDVTQDEFLFLIEGLSALFVLALFAFNRGNREYLWFGVTMTMWAAGRLLTVYDGFHWVSFAWNIWLQDLFAVGYRLALVAFLYFMLRGRRSVWLYLAVVGTLLTFTLPVVFFTAFGREHTVGLGVLRTVGNFYCSVWIVTLVVRRAVGGSFDARLLLVPVVLDEAITVVYVFVHDVVKAVWHVRLRDVNQAALLKEPFTVRLEALGDLLFLFAMLVILINRFIRTRREEERYTGELEAARSVQRLLLPSVAPETPGFAIESVYMPAQEVGGDFFFVAPGKDGSVLVVVGDVSGKGLSAAMSVSAVVGALRSCTEPGPVEVLEQLNRVLYGHINGFATCCAARIGAGGEMRVANAGHLSPYRNGVEMELEGGLPLGMVDGATYAEVRFLLAAGDRLTFLSDGVVEAMNPAGELFGFERTQAMSTQTAAAVAEAAKVFGQEDDITVVGVRYLPAAGV